MAYRGQFGRGRGSFKHYAPGMPSIIFPVNVELPDRSAVTVEGALITRTARLNKFWKYSPYHIEETRQKKRERPDIERYSDLTKPKDKSKSDDLWEFMKHTHLSFPSELIKDAKGGTRPQKKARWNPDADMQKLDFFEKLEQKYLEREEKVEQKKKGDESEDEPEEEVVQEDEEYSDDGDYNQNIEFDDDDDDYNMEDDHDDEPIYN